MKSKTQFIVIVLALAVISLGAGQSASAQAYNLKRINLNSETTAVMAH